MSAVVSATSLDDARQQALEATRRCDWPAAVEAWEGLVAATQGSFEPLFRLAEALFFLGRHDDAVLAAQHAIAARPMDPRPRIILARAQTSLGAHAEAAEAWRAALRFAPDAYEPWARLAQCELRLGRAESAGKALQRALSLRPDDVFGHELAGRVIARTEPEAQQPLLADLLQAVGSGQAVPLLKAIIRAKPTYLAARFELGTLLLKEGQASDALPIFDGLLRAEPGNREFQKWYARALHRAQRWEEAASAWQALLRRSRNAPEPAFRLAQSLRLSGRRAAALPYYEMALGRDPTNIGILRDYARCLAELGRPEVAEAAWQKALAARPDDAALRAEYASDLIRNREFDQAERALQELVGKEPRFDRPALLLIRLLQLRGDAGEILRRFGPLMAAGLPPDADAATSEIALRYGVALQTKGRLEEAAAIILPAHEKAPSDRLGLRSALRLLIARGDYGKARAIAGRALAAQREESWVWREIIAAFTESEQLEVAAAAFGEAAKIFAARPRDLLEVAEVAMGERLGTAVRASLAGLTATDPLDRERASDLALRDGALSLALSFLKGSPPPERAEEWARRIAHIERLRALFGHAADEDLSFPEAVFSPLCERAARRPPRRDWAKQGPVVLVNSGLGAGGAERQIAMTLRGLVTRLGGPENLHLVCTRLTDDPKRRIHLKAIEEAGIAVNDLHGSAPQEEDLADLNPHERELIGLLGPDLAQATLRLYVEFRRLRPRLVHLWQDKTNIDGAVAALLAGVPRIVMCARSTRPVTRQRLRGYMKAAYGALLRLPRVRLCNNSIAGARDYEDWLGLPEGAVGVIHNGFEFERLAAAADPRRARAIRRELGIPDGAPVIGGVLRLVEVKRPLLWVEVAGLVARARPDAHFIIAGDGPMRPEVLEAAQRLGIADRLHLPGHVDVPPWFRVMDVVLLTSRTEGLPNVLIEGQSLGVPVVSTRVGGVVEALDEGHSGYSVEGDAPSDLAERILAILDDASWLARAREHAARFVRDRFGAEAMVERTLQLYGLGGAPLGQPVPAADHIGSSDQDEIAAQRARARAHINAADWPEAEAAWALLLARQPDDAEALLGAGQALFMQRRTAEAKAHFVRALRLSPGPEPLRWLARAVRDEGDDREALTLWSELLAHDPADLEAHLRAAEARAALGEEEAIETAHHALSLHPHDARVVRLLARLLLRAGSTGEALRRWEELAATDGTDAEALFRAGQAAFRLGDAERAEAHLRAAIALPHPDARAVTTLAGLLSWTGRLQEARHLLRRAVRGRPEDPEIARGLFDWIRIAGRGAVLDRYFVMATRRAAGDPAALLRLADRLIAAERPVSARRVLLSVEADSAVGAEAAERLARLALRAGDPEAARIATKRFPAPPAVRSEIASACDFAARLRAEVGDALDPQRAFLARVAAAADRRSHPRYLPRPRAVLHVVNSLAAGGTERQCVTLACAQAADGPDDAAARDRVAVLRTDPGRSGRAIFFLEDLARAGIPTSTLEDHAAGARRIGAVLPELHVPPGALREALLPRQVMPIAAAIQAVRPEAVIAWSPQCMADAALAALALGVPRFVCRSGSVAPPTRDEVTEAEALRYGLWRGTLRTVLSRPMGVLLNNCQTNLNDWLRWLDFDAGAMGERCGVLPNIVALDALSPVPSEEAARLRQRLRIPPHAPVVGSVMRLEQEKGVGLWLQVVRATVATRPDAVFVVAGDGRLADEVRRTIAAAGMSRNVRLLGTVRQELPACYTLFDALLLTSVVEGLPNAVIEAQCFGLPVVAAAVGGVPEALTPDLGHRLVVERDPDRFRDALLEVLTMEAPRRAERLPANRRFVAERFSSQAVLTRLDRAVFGAAVTAAA